MKFFNMSFLTLFFSFSLIGMQSQQPKKLWSKEGKEKTLLHWAQFWTISPDWGLDWLNDLLDDTDNLDVNIQEPQGKNTPLQFLLDDLDKLAYLPLDETNKEVQGELIKLSKKCIDKGANFFIVNKKGESPFFMAPFDIIYYFLEKNSITSKNKDRYDNIALMHILKNENLSHDQIFYLTQTLLQKDLRMATEKNNASQTPLMMACERKLPSFEVIKLLLEQNNDVDQQDNSGNTALLYLFGEAKEEDDFDETDDAIVGLLLSSGAIMNLEVALEYAIKFSRPSMVQLLMEYGASTTDLMIDEETGKTALIKTIENGNFAMVRTLLECGDRTINIADYFGYTPLMYALVRNIDPQKRDTTIFSSDDLEGIKFLITRSNPLLKNYEGQTAFDILKKRYDEVIMRSKEYAKINDSKKFRKMHKFGILQKNAKDLKMLMGMIQRKEKALIQTPQQLTMVQPEKRKSSDQGNAKDFEKKFKLEKE